MKCLIVGGTGQLGRALLASAPGRAEIAAPARGDCDLTDLTQLKFWMAQDPVLVINAAGYTDVNAAESHAEEASRINAEGAGRLAALCRQKGARLIQISTDYVFDGAAGTPYAENAQPHPVNAYGCSKYEGEKLALAENPQTLIVRTSWLYAARGRNFVNTMLTLMRAREEIRVVMDQHGTPTYARNLAVALWRLAGDPEPGIYHFSDGGETSWHEFAVAIRDEAKAVGLLDRCPEVLPVASRDYPSAARRPLYSVLDTRKIQGRIGAMPHWRDALSEMLMAKKNNG